MSDEEIFNEWKSEQYKDQSTEEKMEFVEHLHTFSCYFKKAFIAGLKAGIQDREKARKQGFLKGAELGYQKGLRAKVNITTISDYPIKDNWHKQDKDDIYDFIAKDWSIKDFICIMKDKSRVTATGICDEDYSGGVSTYLEFDHDDEKYTSDDIVWWKEIELPEEK